LYSGCSSISIRHHSLEPTCTARECSSCQTQSRACCAVQRYRLAKRDVLNRPIHFALQPACRSHSQSSLAPRYRRVSWGSGKSVVTSGFFTTTGPVADRYTSARSPYRDRESLESSPTRSCTRKWIGPSIADSPPFRPHAARSVCSCPCRMCCGTTSTATTGVSGRLHMLRMSKIPRMNAPRVRAHLRPIHPHRRRGN